MFNFVDYDGDGRITVEEWVNAFHDIDQDGDGCISRKEWCMKRGTTAMFDRISKRYSVRLTLYEWHQAFERLDVNSDGNISMCEWLNQPKRRDKTPPMEGTVYGQAYA